MANPATLLLERLRSWHSDDENVSADGIRQMGEAATSWPAHALAVQHLREIEQILDFLRQRGRNVSVYDSHLSSWYGAVFAYPNGWVDRGTARISAGALLHLETLADRLDDYVPAVTDGGLEQIRSYLDNVVSVLATDESLPEALKIHVNDVISHVRWCIDNYQIVGDFSLQEAIERLSGSIIRAAANSDDKARWKTVVEQFVWPFTVSVIAAIPQAGLVQLALS